MDKEETLVCCTCGEGYSYNPSGVMGVYSYLTRVSVPSIGSVEGNPLFSSLPSKISVTNVNLGLGLVSTSVTSPTTTPKKMKTIEDDAEEDVFLMKPTPPTSEEVIALNGLLVKAKQHNSEFRLLTNHKTLSTYSSVSAANAIHMQCHQRAVSADRSHKNPKTEWEGSTLRNSRVKCNCLLPLVGYGSINTSSYEVRYE